MASIGWSADRGSLFEGLPAQICKDIALGVEPSITDIKINAIDATRLVDSVVLSREDLVNGQVTIRGKADVRPGSIRMVEYSIDGGKTWRSGASNTRGAFSVDLRPEIGRRYAVILRAITAEGRQTDDADYSFKLEVGTSSNSEEVKRRFSCSFWSIV
jgi:hypothetical protein